MDSRHREMKGEQMKIITVLYDGPHDQELDEKIKNALMGIGCKWYDQGFSIIKQERDICFIYSGANHD